MRPSLRAPLDPDPAVVDAPVGAALPVADERLPPEDVDVAPEFVGVAVGMMMLAPEVIGTAPRKVSRRSPERGFELL